jgi:hypothetical protein
VPKVLHLVARQAHRFGKPQPGFDAAFICNSATPACPVTAIGDQTFAANPNLIERIRAAWAASPIEPI